ncbi:hypothetical protein GGR52DRAFT_581885 [Hypoxylon sp. FL1284]|nr:hypothetical protein GGR52DRAFT_581885 [Hypoxylon sp. FL1284]
MPVNEAVDPAAAAAARANLIRLWTLYSLGVSVTILRTYARIKLAGLKKLWADDFFVWIAMLFYSAQTSLAHEVGVVHCFANNGMTDDERAMLPFSSDEYQMRVTGSKIQLAGWATYALLMCFLKFSVLSFYIRFTEGLGRRYSIRIRVGFGLIIGTSIASVLAIFCGCLPFYRNWQIYPDPGNHCQPAISRPIIWTTFAANISTDIYLILIPIPMLLSSSLKPVKKVASSIVLGAGVFVLVCAMLKTIFVTVDPINGAQLAGEWGTVEAFVAVFTTKLPMIFPLFKAWLGPVFFSSSKPYITRTGFKTIGGGSGSGRSGGRKRQMGRSPSVDHLTTLGTTLGDSQEHMVRGFQLQEMDPSNTSRAAGRRQDTVGVATSVVLPVRSRDWLVPVPC